MNILWIPHDAWRTVVYRRDQHFINRLKKKHKVVVLTWEGVRKRDFKGYVKYLWKTFVPSVYEEKQVKMYKMPKFPTPGKPWMFPHSFFRELNQIILNIYFKRIVKREKIDIAITGPNAAFVGYIKESHIPLIFDLLDCSDWSYDNPWKEMEKRYFLNSDGVLAVSSIAKKHAEMYNRNVLFLPNGVELEKFQTEKKAEAKRKIGMEGKQIISIIGPSLSLKNPFMEAIMNIVKRDNNVRFFIVGENDKVNKLKLKFKHPSIIYLSYIPYSEIHHYFIASDIGLYPVDDSPYNHCRSPLKILEYSAAGSWVVVSPKLEGVASLNLPNVVFCRDNAEDLERTLLGLLYQSPPDATKKLKHLHWDALSEKLEEFLMNILKGQ